MKKKHPAQAIVLIWSSNIVALSIFFASWYMMQPQVTDLYTPSFILWLVLLCLARHGGLFRFVDSKISAGLGNVFEFATLVILPFPLFALSVIISCAINIADRVRRKHPEPFLGPDFNASNVIIGGLLSILAYHGITGLFPNSDLFFTIALFCMALIFGTVQISLLNTLICFDEKISWKQGPVIQVGTLLTEAILMIVGALLATTYLYNPFLILFFIIPALLLQKFLQNANKAQLIYIDEKTGIYNYRYFDEKINELYTQCKKQGKVLSLVFGDMDYLRDVNNNYGHAVGDEAITAIGQVFKQCQKDNFISARFGGEEFVMILPNTDKNIAYQHAEALRKKVEEIELYSENKEKINLSISLGVATFPSDASDIQTLIQVADEALYDAKKNGRNRVCLYGTVTKPLGRESHA